MEKKNSVCFAYYVDDVFVGWYGDTFGSVTKSPKLYNNNSDTVNIITNTFRKKLNLINSTTFEEYKNETKNPFSILFFNDDELLRNKKVELKCVQSPFYDGINPDFDRELYNQKYKEYNDKFNLSEVSTLPTNTTDEIVKRMEAIKEWEKQNPRPSDTDHWLYVDYNLVKDWALNEPTEFLFTITIQ